MKSQVHIKPLMVKGGLKKFTSDTETKVSTSDDISDHWNKETERVHHQFEPTHKPNIQEYTFHNDYGYEDIDFNESYEFEQLSMNIKTFDERSKDRLKQYVNEVIEKEYGYHSAFTSMKLDKLNMKRKLKQKDAQIEMLKAMLAKQTINRVPVDKHYVESHTRLQIQSSIRSSTKEFAKI